MDCVTDIKKYNEMLGNYKLPRIDEIPDLELYMDQVIIYAKKYFSVFPYSDQDNFITPSMINNYVKSGIIPAPHGKKYTRRHIAYILTLFFLKQILSLEEAKVLSALEIKASDEKTAYEAFCSCIETELRSCIGIKTKQPLKEDLTIASVIMKDTALSIANKLYTQALIKYEISKK